MSQPEKKVPVPVPPVLLEAQRHLDNQEWDKAWMTAERVIEENPHHVPTLVLMAFTAHKAKRYHIGYMFGRHAVELAPTNALAWINLGINAHEMWMRNEAVECFQKGGKFALNKNDKLVAAMAFMNLAAIHLDFGEYKPAEEAARKALELDPYNPMAKANLGFAMLGQGNWDGWEFYSWSLGLAHRQKQVFGEEPEWNGAPEKTVVLYGEQGLGDEISFASMLPDAARASKKVIFSCHKKVEGLFRRSFAHLPNVKVYGTRNAKAGDGVMWDEEDRQFDASAALGELGKFFRRSDESFDGKPYLTADPDRQIMWRALFYKIRMEQQKPVIGISWTGGLSHTGAKLRSMTLEKLTPILRGFKAHWVCLQYKDASDEIAAFRKKNPDVDLVQYPTATLTPDYDDTAAMVTELDLVISVQTAIVHLCGGLGQECWVLLPKISQWRYGDSGSTTRWYESVRLFRQSQVDEWVQPMGNLAQALVEKFTKPRIITPEPKSVTVGVKGVTASGAVQL